MIVLVVLSINSLGSISPRTKARRIHRLPAQSPPFQNDWQPPPGIWYEMWRMPSHSGLVSRRPATVGRSDSIGSCIDASFRFRDKYGVEILSKGMERLYRDTSLIRNTLLLGPYSRTIPRVLQWSWGGGVSYDRGTPAGGLGGEARRWSCGRRRRYEAVEI